MIVRRDGEWHMWVTCHPLDDPAEADQMVTEYATSTDGMTWTLDGLRSPGGPAGGIRGAPGDGGLLLRGHDRGLL